ncbi:MAG: hypothetical protein A4E50_02164 [Methanosaeta sp. PtaB.Bin087]|nr:MAG: hypothetical protein A4E50_02164 [Methanosaeta sp. PtaB.Bin087]
MADQPPLRFAAILLRLGDDLLQPVVAPFRLEDLYRLVEDPPLAVGDVLGEHRRYLPGGEVSAVEPEGAVGVGGSRGARRGVDRHVVPPRTDVEPGELPFGVLLLHRGVLAVGIDDQEGDPLFEKLLQDDGGGVRLPAPGLGEDAAVLLDEGIGVELHLQVVPLQEADVEVPLREAQGHLDEVIVGPQNRISGAGRRRGHLQPPSGSDPDHPGEAQDPLLSPGVLLVDGAEAVGDVGPGDVDHLGHHPALRAISYLYVAPPGGLAGHQKLELEGGRLPHDDPDLVSQTTTTFRMGEDLPPPC